MPLLDVVPDPGLPTLRAACPYDPAADARAELRGQVEVPGVDVGARLANVPPERALAGIRAAGSRTGTNQRVPAIWISRRRPKLGWCWDRNPHTWLGTASAADRVR